MCQPETKQHFDTYMTLKYVQSTMRLGEVAILYQHFTKEVVGTPRVLEYNSFQLSALSHFLVVPEGRLNLRVMFPT